MYLGFDGKLLTMTYFKMISKSEFFPYASDFIIKATVEKIGKDVTKESEIETILLQSGFEPIKA